MKRILMITVLSILMPAFAMGMEPGCGDMDYEEDAYYESEDKSIYEKDEGDHPIIGGECQYGLKVDEVFSDPARPTSEWKLVGHIGARGDCNQPLQRPWTYFGWTLANFLPPSARASVTVRIYSAQFDVRRSCNNCQASPSSVNARIEKVLNAGSARTRVFNSEHTATHNGTTLRLNQRFRFNIPQ